MVGIYTQFGLSSKYSYHINWNTPYFINSISNRANFAVLGPTSLQNHFTISYLFNFYSAPTASLYYTTPGASVFVFVSSKAVAWFSCHFTKSKAHWYWRPVLTKNIKVNSHRFKRRKNRKMYLRHLGVWSP